MKKMLVMMMLCLCATSAFSITWSESSYYSRQGSRNLQCGPCYGAGYDGLGYPVYLQRCTYREWNSFHGCRKGYVNTGYSWQYRQDCRTWWNYQVLPTTRRCY